LSGDPEPTKAGTATRALVLLFAVPFGTTLALALASFPLGLYTALFTTLTPGVGPNSPVRLYLWLGPVPVGLLPLPFGSLFCAMTAVYLLLFAIAAARGSTAAGAFSLGTRSGLSALLSSDLVIATVSIGFLTLTATAIDTITQAAGVQIGGLQGSDATIFISTETSPLVEEFGFRVCIIGLVAVILSLGMGWKDSLKALWRPASVHEGQEVRAGKILILLVALAASSAAFGLAHVASGSGWEAGKLPEAVFGGLVLGYVYMEYGFHIAVLTHWGVDYLGTAYSFFGEGAHGIPWGSYPGYILQQIVTADLIYGVGLFSLALVAYLGARRLKGLSGTGENPPV